MSSTTKFSKTVPLSIWESFKDCPCYTFQGDWAFGDSERISKCDCKFHHTLRSLGIPEDFNSSDNLWKTIKDCPSLTARDGRVVDESAIGLSGCSCEFHRMLRSVSLSEDRASGPSTIFN
jgi:hypothetical protein